MTDRLKILVIGKSGKVARALRQAAHHHEDIEIKCFGRDDLDIARTGELMAGLEEAYQNAPFDMVINAAAYTDVDGAENDQKNAFLINSTAPAILAAFCEKRRLGFIHISTDCVFDGAKPTPYLPEDTPSPINVYGQSKYQGEISVLQSYSDSTILRVSWVFDDTPDNFVGKVLSWAQSQKTIKVVSDQRGGPTHALDIAEALLNMARDWQAAPSSIKGLHHMAGQPFISRYEWAIKIWQEGKKHKDLLCEYVESVQSGAFKTPAVRPANACLAMSPQLGKLRLATPDWQKRLEMSVAKIASSL